MLLHTTTNEALEVEPRDIEHVTASGAAVIKTLLGSGRNVVQLTDASAAEVRAAIAPAPRTEFDLFNLAAMFGRRDTLPFRVPGTNATHQVECVVMEPSDVAMFASAIGVPTVAVPREVFARQMEGKRRRLSDRLEQQRQVTLAPDDDAGPIGGEGGHDALKDYAKRAQLVPAIPEAWRQFARAIAELPDGAEANIAGMRATALELLGEKVPA